MTLRLLDTFSGIGGFSYAAEHLVGGFQTVQFVERDPFCQKVLCKHWPTVPIHDDICTYNPAQGIADVICGGFPCQDISRAGKGAGIKQGTRSGLFYELMRVVCLVRPRFVVLENVSAILSNGLDTVLGELAEAGYDAEWACIRASDVGACHRRDRWWCVAYANDARHQAEREKQQTAWTEQHGRLDAAYATSMFGHGNTSEQQGQPQRGAFPKSGDGHWPDAAHVDHQRLEGRFSASLCERPQQRPTWPRNSHRLSPDWRGYLSEPVLRRGDARLSNRVDRLKALGNTIVPQCAAIPLARVKRLWEEEQ